MDEVFSLIFSLLRVIGKLSFAHSKADIFKFHKLQQSIEQFFIILSQRLEGRHRFIKRLMFMF